jgi:AraC-like DNA-binding protein
MTIVKRSHFYKRCIVESVKLNRVLKPKPPLDNYIECLWHFTEMPPRLTTRVVPSGALELVINLEEDEIRTYEPAEAELSGQFPGAAVAGAYKSFFLVDVLRHGPIMGAHFKPGGAFPFFGGLVSEIADTHIGLETLWGGDARRLRERLYEAPAAELRLQILEEALQSCLSRGKELRRDVMYALNRLKQCATPIGDLAKELGLSHRRFIEVFTTQVGMTPNLFRRIRRFQRTSQIAGRAPMPNWGELSLDCGYFDQSHMIRDFQAFSGFTPSDYVGRLNEQVKENLIADA